MTIKKNTLKRVCSTLFISTFAMTGVSNANLHQNSMAGTKDSVVNRLSLWRGDTDRLTVANWQVGGRSGGKLRVKHRRAGGWESLLGRPKLSKRVDKANIEYKFYTPGHAWQYRWVGKFFGLQPVKPHFGGNRNQAPVWESWSARMMWFGIQRRVQNGDDNSARPSAYLYTQDREQGSSGRHNRSSLEFRKNRWYTADMEVSLNNHTSSRAPRRNGRVRMFINNTLEKDVKDQILVGRIPSGKSKNDARIHQVALHSYYGGNKNDPLMVPTVAETLLFFDDLVVTE